MNNITAALCQTLPSIASVDGANEASPLSDAYRQHCRPAVGAMLKALRMDVAFHRAEADSLFYFDAGDEIAVTDFLGGYGASIFGHNHPRLVAKAQSLLTNRVPFNAQMSVRGQAARLAAQLDLKLFDSTGFHYVSTFANSGAEAVEAAIKHARFAFYKRLQAVSDLALGDLEKLGEALRRGLTELADVSIDPTLLQDLPQPTDELQLEGVIAHLHYRIEQLRDHKPALIALEGSFHGKTLGALALTENPVYRDPFYVESADIVFVGRNDLATLHEHFQTLQLKVPAVDELPDGKIVLGYQKVSGIAALFVEPIQGEGGINPIDREFLQFCRELTDEHDVALVFDEIQSGMGRTGTWLYSSQIGVAADYYTLSKSLGGGLAKISALLVRSEQYVEEFGLLHTSTFTEDDFSCALALEALRLLDEDQLPQRAATAGAYLKERLSALQARYPDVLREISGAGLMLGLKFVDQSDSNCASFRLLARQDLFGYAISGYLFHLHRLRVAPSLSQGGTIRVEPSAYISLEACDELLSALTETCEIVRKMQSHLLLQFIVGRRDLGSSSAHADYRSRNRPWPLVSQRRKIGFVGHFIEAEDLAYWDPTFACFTVAERAGFVDQVYEVLDPDYTDEIDIDSPNGEQVRLIFSGICATSKHFADALAAKNLSTARDKVQRAVDLLAAQGCAVVGLGAYTSIVTHNCKTLHSRGVALTSGNSLTVGMGLEALKKAAGESGIEWCEARLSVVGATGNIASTYSELAAESVRSINLVGRSRVALKRLQRLANRIYADAFAVIIAAQASGEPGTVTGIARGLLGSNALRAARAASTELGEIDWFGILSDELGDSAPISIDLDMHSLAGSNVILTATNSASPIIFPAHLGEHATVICDISVPNDVDASVRSARPDVTVIHGANVEITCRRDFQLKGFNMPIGQTFACLSETVLLGLTGITEHYSYGPISKTKVNKIMHLARLHGFRLGP